MSVSAAEYSTQYTLYCTVTVQYTGLLAQESTTAGQSINPPFCHNRHHGTNTSTPPVPTTTLSLSGGTFSVSAKIEIYDTFSIKNVLPLNPGSFNC